MARLRVGSVLSTRRGTSYRVIEPLMEVASNGRVVPAVVVEKRTPGGPPQRVLIPVGALTNRVRQGGRHKPGPGVAIDWTQVEQRVMTRESTVLRPRWAGRS